MNIRLLSNRVAVRPDPEETVSKGGIALTKAASQLRETVVAVGPDHYDNKCKFIPTVVQVGDRVAYIKQASILKENFGGENLLIMSEDQIIAVLGTDTTTEQE